MKNEVLDAIIAGIGAADTATEQALEIQKNIDRAGFVIVPKSMWFRPDDGNPGDVA